MAGTEAASIGDSAVRSPAARYWQAQAFADLILEEFNDARRRRDLATVRDRFYVLAAYYRRTLSILHSAFERRSETLAAAALRNLVVLQRVLMAMREVAPHTSYSTIALESDLHRRVNLDIVHRVLRDARGPLRLGTIVRRFNGLTVIGDAREPAIAASLLTLVQTGHAVEKDGSFAATDRPFLDADVDRVDLALLFGQGLARRLRTSGFEGISAVLDQRDEFRETLTAETGFGDETAVLAVAAAEAMAASQAELHGSRRAVHAPLADSTHPRPYQRLLHAILRAHRYAGQVIEAPAGSGKTFVGMLCIEDWLRTMGPGQSIMVLVPTVNYQRQWVSELCVNQAGLRLHPQLVYAGTMAGLAALQKKGAAPTVILVTYAAMGRLVSPVGKGGFDEDAAERFLQANNIRHVILDEVHRVAEAGSGAAAVVQVFRRWLRDGSLSSLIGFSATVAAYERQLSALGLELAVVIPGSELIAQGWVAPFAEFGAPYSYSERESRIAEMLAEYRDLLRAYYTRLGGYRLRSWFAALPRDRCVDVAEALGMYADRLDPRTLIAERLRKWESGEELRMNEAQLVIILQVIRGWSDARLMAEAGAADEASEWLARFSRIREELRALLPPGPALRAASVERFGELDPADEAGLAARHAVASTVTGVYLGLRGWSRQAGEGRVATVRAIIDAENHQRAVSGVIIFERPTTLRWHGERASPGYRGAAGLFAEMLRQRAGVPIAALSNEMYVPDDPTNPLHDVVAEWIFRRVVAGEQGRSLADLLVAAARLNDQESSVFRTAFQPIFDAYVERLRDPVTRTLGAFEGSLLRPLRAHIRAGEAATAARLLPWLSTDQHHLRSSIRAILDYAWVAHAFRTARSIEIACGDGSIHRARVVPVGSGTRRQRFLDLTARLVDADDLPIDVVIVSSWARTGWNVLTPNVLIDATATRDLTAWQQLRGRAMRPRPGWSDEAQSEVRRLLGRDPDEANQAGGSNAPARATSGLEALLLHRDGQPVVSPSPVAETRRVARAISIMLTQNKVTHIYELVRARGSEPQVRYVARSHSWERIEAIAEKHRHQECVRASDGALLAGPEHAPLIVASDPRHDRPDAFQARLEEELAGADERIVRGWITAASKPPASP